MSIQTHAKQITLSSGEQIKYRTCGSGPRLALIHGFAVHSAIWDLLLDTLAPHFELILIDLPGFGLQTEQKVPETSSGLMLYLAELLRATKVEYVAGYSMGANICYEYAKTAPDSNKKIVLIAPVLLETSEAKKLHGLFQVLGRNEWQTSLVKAIISRSPFKQLFFLATGLGNVRHPFSISTCMYHLRVDANKAAVFALLARTFTIEPAKKKISTPTTLIMGERDGLGTKEVAKRIAATLEQGEVITLPRLYHLLPLEDPKLLAETLIKVLS